MPGAGKSELACILERHGFAIIHFGDITWLELEKRKLERNEKNERFIRELLRTEHGMAAYAILNMPRINTMLASSNVAIDGLYSWEEYIWLKERYSSLFQVLAIWASPATRYERLSNRLERSLSFSEASDRDRAEIENINKGGPIAMADFTIRNESSLEALATEVEDFIQKCQ